MVIYKTKEKAENAAIESCIKNKIEIDSIEEGTYKGGRYECLFILNKNGDTIFEGAYY